MSCVLNKIALVVEVENNALNQCHVFHYDEMGRLIGAHPLQPEAAHYQNGGVQCHIYDAAANIREIQQGEDGVAIQHFDRFNREIPMGNNQAINRMDVGIFRNRRNNDQQGIDDFAEEGRPGARPER